MSRIPLGLWLSCLLLSAGCASMAAPKSFPPGVSQQQPHQPNASPRTSAPVGIPVSEPVVPQQQRSLDRNRTRDPNRIDLGEPAQFPQSRGPVTAQKPSTSTMAPQQEVFPQRLSAEGRQSAQSEIANWADQLVSTAGRPVELTHAGLGKYRVLILGSIYGNEPESIALMDAMTREASTFAQSPSYTFVLVRTPNPDGLVEHIRTNHNGVDLNRNFPSTWFTATPNRLTGPHPGSEIETQNLMRIIKGFQPHRVVHVRSSIGQRPLVLVNDQLKHAVEKMTQSLPVDAGAFRGDYKAGSLEEFATVRANAELMVIHLPPKGFQQMSAKELFQLATMNFDAAQSTRSAEDVAQESPSATTAAEDRLLSSQQQAPTPDGEKGYVEFLPPPPGGSPINQASKSAPLHDPKFYELPPPPGR